jgi:hypothetical protein
MEHIIGIFRYHLPTCLTHKFPRMPVGHLIMKREASESQHTLISQKTNKYLTLTETNVTQATFSIMDLSMMITRDSMSFY